MPWKRRWRTANGGPARVFGSLALVGCRRVGVYTFECMCGGSLTSSLQPVMDGRKMDCGCGRGSWKSSPAVREARTRTLDEMEGRTAAIWIGLMYSSAPMSAEWSGSSESYWRFREDVGPCSYMSRLARRDSSLPWMSGNVRWEIDRDW